MKKESLDYLEMAYRSIQCFSNDGRLLLPELDELVSIALKDGVVDDNEKRVLQSIFSRLDVSELTPDIKIRIEQIRGVYGF